MNKPLKRLKELNKTLRRIYSKVAKQLEFAEDITRDELLIKECRIEHISRSVIRAIENKTNRPVGYRKEKVSVDNTG